MPSIQHLAGSGEKELAPPATPEGYVCEPAEKVEWIDTGYMNAPSSNQRIQNQRGTVFRDIDSKDAAGSGSDSSSDSSGGVMMTLSKSPK